MAWFRKEKKRLTKQKRELPPDVWAKCDSCGEIIYREKLADNFFTCPKCDHHFRIGPDDYAQLLLDDGLEEEFDADLRSVDPLNFVGPTRYADRYEKAIRKNGRKEAVVTGSGRIDDLNVKFGVMDFGFIGGSMGSVVGEKIARVAERALDEENPLIIVSASGGARMMEGVLSLMQMVKTSAALGRLHKSSVPYISLLTHPTTGGVTASFAMLGDVIIAEPGALIGFAGPRVIEQTIRQELPEGFQRSEFLLEHGMVDMVVPRPELKPTISKLLQHMVG
ncbi:MAG: acetyl-CoA carboxylase carboxyltransferase subunit beta [Gemmatimonadetes bacterium]|uniref:Acetyl-coenzyme A carboxylase carboxyl transferase subunit beta n=1 Tax=Candidatus Kutchimonas denitrificans TaxID=3056748 RepID=A0AAE5CCV7_9BACT|nr:acetyl-CoA carboxylase carboxyltransferase subunit beta [Gemmatimonadota bacterium]NIR76200.1 acetyl-CoA carboxylase carboxyltransferase subunit beta [Candidatus Kutchimonas denitrificans]NIS00640.1 acetyl-CoA carboxylase carboxyltransferase subunit beta [Gemmatimonadota bacterium]NIT66785.1 acetyl-CoA carboxylase carboxyltransferase subunit beta [Gemmatimonadota bacterium]NIV23384.1 acetyl-CoA carboxylase carboxyltransferase subunit beta [Gemmatimonadota bacterium]